MENSSLTPGIHHLLGLYDSPYVRRVAITLQYYGIPYTHESLSVFRHVAAMQPNNPLLRVPQLTTPEGDQLYESVLIVDYLDELARAAGRGLLIPAAGAARHRVWQTAALALAATDKAIAIMYEFRRPEALRWPEWLQRLRAQMRVAFGGIETRLGPTNECQADVCPTHADIMAAVAVSFVRYVKADEWPAGEFPRLEALSAQLEATPMFLAVPQNEAG